MSNVADYSEERAARGAVDLSGFDQDLATVASEEIAEALARVAALPDEARPAPVERPKGPPELQWERFRPQFVEAMEGGLYTIDDLEAEIAAGQAYFWPGCGSAVVAKRVTYPSGETVMQVMWAVGDVSEVLALAPGIEATARLLGCSSMLVEGRKGWERVLKTHGYEPWSVTVRKAL